MLQGSNKLNRIQSLLGFFQEWLGIDGFLWPYSLASSGIGRILCSETDGISCSKILGIDGILSSGPVKSGSWYFSLALVSGSSHGQGVLSLTVVLVSSQGKDILSLPPTLMLQFL